MRLVGDPRAHPLDDIHEGYDGSAWEYYPDPGIVVRTVGAAARTTRHTALFDDPLVDRETFMLDGRRQVVPMHAFGKQYTTVLDRSGITSMEINPDLPRSIFSPPDWNRTPLQQMIQRMYDERDEAAVLRQNVADHPSSARAHFGLGRAFAAAGDDANARNEYSRALAIDPNYSRARAALAEPKT